MDDVRIKNNSLDLFKLFCCILTISAHVFFPTSSNAGEYFYCQWFVRFIVPFFFISTGFFFAQMKQEKVISYLKRIFILYMISAIAYIPIMIYVVPGGHSILYYMTFGYSHLWYLVALFEGLILVWLTQKIPSNIKYIPALILFLVGIFFGSYYKIFNTPFLIKCDEFFESIGKVRSAPFLAYPVLMVGVYVYENKFLYEIGTRVLFLLLILSFAAGFFEADFLFNHTDFTTLSNDITIFGGTPALFMVMLCLKIKNNFEFKTLRKIRKIADWVYIVQYFSIYPLIIFAGYLDYPGRLFLISAAASLILSLLIEAFLSFLGSKK